jgi:hypothetical protein
VSRRVVVAAKRKSGGRKGNSCVRGTRHVENFLDGSGMVMISVFLTPFPRVKESRGKGGRTRDLSPNLGLQILSGPLSLHARGVSPPRSEKVWAMDPLFKTRSPPV